ncbi:exodeoxyribonuclease VII large subunit [Bacillus solimangrovi]|uniref:Exodeoxyribonuclease 7 large subunit n=1 Tax=Bacillus solimangrovi TaxID=1305675 RepID=A0A1E5LK97_9BACI|nr:exodeoxyribonuclease VII large subunit [Bacillus solimangrovi]OEH94491.1 exodeoxyribonuclease VII large subunit [Bacillus solimangrovi]
MSTKPFLTVTALTKYIKRRFDDDSHLQEVWIKGEISNFKLHSRGHMYFTLKDENARIQSVMFAGANRFMKFKPENGMKVLVRGEVSVYEAYGQYQLYAKEMQPDGIGNLYLAFEELKKKLELQGFFSNEYKQPLPSVPSRIGVITSPTGAAIRDILTTLNRRFPIAHVTIIPVLVQGENAAASIAKGIEQANEIGKFDLLITGRGGGSLEDLWPFNEEIVARAIFHSNIPIISAVGHETDVTIADFVADMRAATPTAAAELAVPHIEELIERLKQHKVRLIRSLRDQTTYDQERLRRLQKSYAFRYPEKLLVQKEQELDRLFESLQKQATHLVHYKQERLTHLRKRLKQQHPFEQLQQAITRKEQTTRNLDRAFTEIKKGKEFALQTYLSKLGMLSPLKVMERGYSLVYNERDKLIKSVEDVKLGDRVQVQVKDGQLDCQVWGLEEREQ